MSATADLRKLLDDIEARASADGAAEARLKMFEDTLVSVSLGLQDVVRLMEEDDDAALIDAIRGLKITAPDVKVDFKPPDINVNVPPAQVVVMPAESAPVKGWKFVITQRDGNGAIRAISMQPE